MLEGVGRFAAMGYALLEVISRQPIIQLDLYHEHDQQHLKTSFVFVSNNRFEVAPFSFIRRQTLDKGHLHVLYVPQLPAPGTLNLRKVLRSDSVSDPKAFSLIAHTFPFL